MPEGRAHRAVARDLGAPTGAARRVERSLLLEELVTANERKPREPLAQELRSGSHVQADELIEAELEIGCLIGERYVIEQHISSGGFGAVYRASDRAMRHHQVALKLLHHRSRSDEEQNLALRELKLLATVSHPSVVQFKDYGFHEGRLWFAMPWYRGQTLDRVISDVDPDHGLTRADAKRLFTRLAHGLAAMHAVGIHHHDIKPENIFVAQIAGFPGGFPLFLDLGIATQRGEDPVGLTVEYASPETAAAALGMEAAPIGGAADVFSLALVLRNALDPTLVESPLEANQPETSLRARAKEPVVLSRRRDLSYLAPSFRRWLSLDPNERPTAAELANELAILEAPEEKRAAQRRFVQRFVPALLLMGLVTSGLALRLRQKDTEVDAQGRLLQRQRRTEQVLRMQAAAKSSALDATTEQLDHERRLRKDALDAAARLGRLLSEARKSTEDLRAQHTALTAQHTELSAKHVALATQHEELSARHATLTAQHTELSAKHSALSAQHEELSTQHAALTAQHTELSAKHERLSLEQQRLIAQRDGLKDVNETLTRERAELLARKEQLSAALATASGERDRAERERAVLERERARMADNIAALERRIAAVSRTHAQQERKTSSMIAQRERPTRRRAEARPQASRPTPKQAPRTRKSSGPRGK